MVYRLALSMSPYTPYHYKSGDLCLDRVLVDIDNYEDTDVVNDPE